MMENDIYTYSLHLRPYEDDDGGMRVSLGVSWEDNDHPEEWVDSSIYSLLLMSTAFQMMNEDEAFYAVVKKRMEELRDNPTEDNHMHEILGDAIEEDVDNAPTIEYADADRKIVKLTFNSKTKGNA